MVSSQVVSTAKAATTSGATAADDSQGDGDPFGTVLARSLEGADGKNVKAGTDDLTAAAMREADARKDKDEGTDDRPTFPGALDTTRNLIFAAASLFESRGQSHEPAAKPGAENAVDGARRREASPLLEIPTNMQQGASAERAAAPHAGFQQALDASSAREAAEAATEAALAHRTDAVEHGAASHAATAPEATAQLLAAGAAPATVVTVAAPLPTEPKHVARFNDEFATQVTFFVRDEVKAAEMRVTPPELGPIDVRIDVSKGEASVAFVCATPEAQNAVENALPRLREMLADNGLALGGAQVSTRDPQTGDEPRGRDGGASGRGDRGIEAVGALGRVETPAPTLRLGIGVIDTFA